MQGFASNLAEYIFLSISDWASRLADIVAVLVLAIYFMLEGDIAYRWALSFFPRNMRLRLDRTLMKADVRMGRWLLGQGLLMLILGISSTIVFERVEDPLCLCAWRPDGGVEHHSGGGRLFSMALVLLWRP